MIKPSKRILIKTKIPGSTEDLAGKHFGKWVVVEYVEKKGCHRLWLCRCECGIEKNVSQSNLLRKLSTQCKRCAWTSRRNPDKKLSRVWKTLLNSGKLPEIWQNFGTFKKAVGNPPNDFARIARYDNALPHGPGNTFWMTSKTAPQVLKKRKKLRKESIFQNKVLLKISTAKTKDEKKRYIIAARKTGYTYEVIGIAAGLTSQRIQQIIAKSAK